MATLYHLARNGLLAFCLINVTLSGCGKSPEPPTVADGPNALIRSVVVADGAETGTAATEPNKSIRFDQTFDEAVSTDVLDGQFPPEVTLGGKGTGRLRASIEERWPKIRLTDSANKPIPFTLKMETSRGPIEIALKPELAPNHVRNLLALVEVGYYEGLVFERNVQQEDEAGRRSDLLIAGCPLGTGDEGYGHLGYYVRSEFQPDLKHAEGTVGFWHEEDENSAGTRLYITLGKAPAIDGKFTVVGNVTSGIDVLKQIAAQPVKSSDPESADNEKPVQPTLIKKVAVLPGR